MSAKVENIKARGLDISDVLSNGYTVMDRAYSPVDDKFIFSLIKFERVRPLLEAGDSEAWDIFLQEAMVIVVKADEKFDIIPRQD